MKILIIEDNESHAYLLTAPLKSLSELILVDSQEEAKEKLNMDTQIKIIILDVAIFNHSKEKRKKDKPYEGEKSDKMFGMELLNFLVKEKKFPIENIIVTTSNHELRIELLNYIPGENILRKPFSGKRLRFKIEELIKKTN